ncbi:Tlg2-vesicle protein [Histoplasma capsulatum var. duboisii H88]|uniref:Golgi apparatus membrane protein TVP38 n=2 Tax=Ajellomyces capsulatus TaxID=5037 RepID=F0U5Z4_AJEC8|nr:golgi apparatus membrane protein tvp38 [Histoplasma capsulatum H143]EGC41385.1 Tlg2-vesicle protein [Histoplasma capsulatum var. duboisii H88]QSS52194.1 Tlg2-vesicle protein [Histoplasma capsulatum var. duboisii H88]
MHTDLSPATNDLSPPLRTHPDESLSPTFESIHPPWSRPRSSLFRSSSRRSSSLFAAPPNSLRDRAINNINHSYQRVSSTFQRMTLLQKVGSVLAAVVVIALGLGFMILTGHIFKWLEPVAEDWENSKLAYFVLMLCTFTVSFPPLLGWSTIGTIAGFIFGVWKGWLIYGIGTVLGSTCSFIVSRTLLSSFVHRLMEHDKRFAALALTLKYDGLKLLCMIRLCPLPYSICNGAISTFPTVHPLTYGLATTIISPKLLVPTFIGSRLRILAQNGETMSAGSKAINIISILVSMVVGIFTGWYIYRNTLARSKELEAEERANNNTRRLVANDAHQPQSPGIFSDDSEETAAAQALDEESRIGFRRDGVAHGYDLDADIDDDHVAIDPIGYHDDFTDNDSDVFDDGDGDGTADATETFSLHRHIESK